MRGGGRLVWVCKTDSRFVTLQIILQGYQLKLGCVLELWNRPFIFPNRASTYCHTSYLTNDNAATPLLFPRSVESGHPTQNNFAASPLTANETRLGVAKALYPPLHNGD